MNEKGFTLVEVIIAMALTGIMAIVFIPLLTAQYVNIQKTGDQSDATYNAVEYTEKSIDKAKKGEDIIDPADPDAPKIEVKEPDDPTPDTVVIKDLGVNEKVTTIKVTGEDKREGEKAEIITGVIKD